MALIRFLVVGFVAGWIIGRIVRGRGFGFFGNLLIGAIGSLIGGYLYGFLGVPVHNIPGSIVMAVVGSIVLFLAFSFLKPLRRALPGGRSARKKEAKE